ncbi:hypothetical protein CFP56_033650 [Quercus suber]|uniref:Uncharacterized protein n=1 Tax=Quercus suber TaxID=58331 RepID=A0AAW0JE99_QUESU
MRLLQLCQRKFQCLPLWLYWNL